MKNNIVLSSLLLITACVIEECSINRAADQQAPPVVQVSTMEVNTGNAAYYDTYPATTVALNQVDLKPEVSGYISEMYIQDGSLVTQGTPLYAIDRRQYQAAYDQMLANLNVAKSNLAKAQSDADRYTGLAKYDAIAHQTLDHALIDLESAKMQVAAAEASVNSAETNLHYSVISAPFDGTVGISQVKRGSSVIAGQTVLNTISSNNPIAVDCAVDEKLISRFNALLKTQSSAKDSTFTLILPDQSIYPFPGKLSFLDRSADVQTGTIQVRIIFPNLDRSLKPGLTCDLRVRTTQSSPVVLIPYKTVTEQMGEYFVFTVINNRAVQRRVQLGMDINGQVVVKDGLHPGDQLVTEGMQRLRDNTAVRAIPEGSSPLAMKSTNH